MKNRSKLKTALLIVLIIFVIIISYIGANFLSVWSFSKKDQTRQADAAIVLGAAAYPHAPSPVYKERLNHAVKLYNEGYVNYIILTGGYGKGNVKSDALIGAEYVIECGVPEEAILLEERSTVTEENLRSAAEIMSEHGLKNALIVSDPFHMRRAMTMAKDAGIEAYSSPTTTSRYTDTEFLAKETFYYIGYKWLRLFK